MYQHHECATRGCPSDVRPAHRRATLAHRARVASKLHGKRPRLRSVHPNGSIDA